MKPLVVALLIFAGRPNFAQQSTAPAGSICGHVDRVDTHRPVGSALVSIDDGQTTPFLPQKTAADGSFCFGSVPPGEYTLVPYKTGFLPVQPKPGAPPFTHITLRSGEPSRLLHMGLLPAPSVSQAPDDAFNVAYIPTQRLGMDIEYGDFSADGRYLAIAVSDIFTRDVQQVWRYDLVTHQLLAITAKPVQQLSPEIEGIGWIENDLYTTVIDLMHGGTKLFFKTEGETTSSIPSLPIGFQIQRWHRHELPRHVSSYLIVGTPITPATVDLYRAPIGKAAEIPIATVSQSNWTAIDDPPTVFYGVPGWYGGIGDFNLQTLRRHLLMLPMAVELQVLAGRRIPGGFRVAYAIHGSCAVTESPEGTDPWVLPGNNDLRSQHRPSNLCFVDIPEEPQRTN